MMLSHPIPSHPIQQDSAPYRDDAVAEVDAFRPRPREGQRLAPGDALVDDREALFCGVLFWGWWCV